MKHENPVIPWYYMKKYMLKYSICYCLSSSLLGKATMQSLQLFVFGPINSELHTKGDVWDRASINIFNLMETLCFAVVYSHYSTFYFTIRSHFQRSRWTHMQLEDVGDWSEGRKEQWVYISISMGYAWSSYLAIFQVIIVFWTAPFSYYEDACIQWCSCLDVCSLNLKIKILNNVFIQSDYMWSSFSEVQDLNSTEFLQLVTHIFSHLSFMHSSLVKELYM